jgi:hypothetical protein
MSTSWQTTGKINPQVLTESRLQMHYAIQFIAATGAALAEPLTDYSHTSLEWNPELEVFVGALIRANKNFRLALEPVSLTQANYCFFIFSFPSFKKLTSSIKLNVTSI